LQAREVQNLLEEVLAEENFRPAIARSDSPMLMIGQKIGKLTFNAASTDVLREAKIREAALIWDATRRVLVIRGVKKNEQRSALITFHKRHRSAIVTSTQFLRFIKWNSPENQTIPAIWNARERRMEIAIPAKFLGEAPSSVSGTSKRAAKRRR
jgi:hypothetical protein